MKNGQSGILKLYFLEQRWQVLLAILVSIISAVCNILLPLSIGKFFDLSAHETSTKGRLISMTGWNIESLGEFWIFFSSLLVIRLLAGYGSTFSIARLEEGLAQRIRQQFFETQLHQTSAAFASQPVSKYLNKYSGDLNSIRNYYVKGRIRLVADGIFLLLALSILFKIQALLTGIMFSILVAGTLIMAFAGRSLVLADEKRQDAKAIFTRFTDARLRAFSTIKIFNRITPETNQFNRLSEKWYKGAMAYENKEALLKALQPVLFYLAIGAILFAGAQSAEMMQDPGSLLVFVLMMLYMQSVVRRMMRFPTIRKKGITALQQMHDLIDLPSEKSDEQKEVRKKDIIGRVQIVNLNFGFSSSAPLLKNFNAHFYPGSVTLITGKQGSGKSTLCNLLLGLLEAESGDILLDSNRYSDLTKHQLRKFITYVGSQAPLLGSTVFECISYNTREEKRDPAFEMITRLGLFPQLSKDEALGLKIGEAGAGISASERKLLQFARAFLTEKPVLILDEPWEGLDQASIEKVVSYIRDIRKKTSIIVAATDTPVGLSADLTYTL